MQRHHPRRLSRRAGHHSHVLHRHHAHVEHSHRQLEVPEAAQPSAHLPGERATNQLNERQPDVSLPQERLLEPDQQLTGLGQLKIEAARAIEVPSPPISTAPLNIVYHFTVGSERIPHTYEAERGNDGKVTGHAYLIDAKGQKTAADMQQFQLDMLQTFAKEDIAAGHGGQNVSLSRIQQNRMADAHASTLLALKRAQEGAAKQQEVEDMLVTAPNLVAGWVRGHIDEARKLLENPNYMEVAEKYRHDNPGTLLSDALGSIGVTTGSETKVAGVSRPLSTPPAF